MTTPPERTWTYQVAEIVDVLAPRIRKIGVREVARRSFVPHPQILRFLDKRRGLSGIGMQAIARACGYHVDLKISRIEPEKPPESRGAN